MNDGKSLSLGLCAGLCFGVLIGTLTDNIGTWMPIGLALGVGFADLFKRIAEKKNKGGD